jgi:hypothetical protein
MSADKQAQRRRPPSAGRGRKHGELNKLTREVRNLILGALDKAGGEKYLVRQAHENPVAFLALRGKCLPRDLKIEPNVDIKINFVGMNRQQSSLVEFPEPR